MSDLSILRAAREVPDRACLIAPGARLSYSQTASRVQATLAWLRQEGVRGPDTPVAITPRASIDSAIAIFALIELGAPIVLLHPRWTGTDQASVIEKTRPTFVLPHDWEVPVGDVPGADAPSPPSDATCLAIIHTSGSSNEPKGVVLSRRAFIAAADASAKNLGWSQHDRWLLCLPPAHVGGLSVLIRCLLARRTVVVSARETFDAQSVVSLIESEAVTLVSMVPTMLRRVVDESPRWKPPSSLRAVLVGGAPLPALLHRRAIELGFPVVSTYGCTEACSQITAQTIDQIGLPGCGAPLFGLEVRLSAGVIEVRGPTMMDHYLGQRTESCFDQQGWFSTGDVGEFAADGQLLVQGRADAMIVSGGENVSPAQVEAVLVSLPGVRDACVFGVPDDDWGQRVVAALHCDDRLDRSTLRRDLAQALSPHARPTEVCVVGELPTTPLGKLDRQKISRDFVTNLEPL